MSSDRFKRKDIGTLKQRWIMKHKDRADDIPNCPSIENIVNMSMPNEIPQSEKSATNITIANSSISDAKLSDGSIGKQTISTGDENLAKSESQEMSKCFLRHNHRQQQSQESSKSGKRRNLMSCISSSEYNVQATPSEKRDDIPMCPNIQNICELDENAIDDDMCIHRFSRALYQLGDDFFLLLTKFTHFLKDHPRPATMMGLIVASYLIISYLELSTAALVEFIAQAIWPISHVILLFTERLSINFGSFLHSSDDIMKGAYCDIAEIWCKYFEMMCEDRCSFFNMAVERLRTN